MHALHRSLICALLAMAALDGRGEAMSTLPPLTEELRPLAEVPQPILGDAKACVEKLTGTAASLKGASRGELDRLIASIKAPFVAEALFTPQQAALPQLKMDLVAARQKLDSVKSRPPLNIDHSVNVNYWQLLQNNATDRISGLELKIAEVDKSRQVLEQQLASVKRDAASWADAGRPDIGRILNAAAASVAARTGSAAEGRQLASGNRQRAKRHADGSEEDDWRPLISAANAIWGPVDGQTGAAYSLENYIILTASASFAQAIEYGQMQEAVTLLQDMKKQAEAYNVKPDMWALIRGMVFREAALGLKNSKGCTLEESSAVVGKLINKAMREGAIRSGYRSAERAAGSQLPVISIKDAALSMLQYLIEQQEKPASDSLEDPFAKPKQ